MLNGIEILNESYIPNGSEYVYENELLFVLFVLAMLFFIGAICGVVSFKKITEIVGYIIAVLSLISIVGLCMYSYSPSDIKQYQVTISDNASMTEFNKRYDVISVEGKIWTIMEKEEE